MSRFFESLLVKCRFVTILPVVFALLGTFVLFFIASYDVLKVLLYTFEYFTIKDSGIDLHEDIVALLVGAVDLYLMALVLFIFSYTIKPNLYGSLAAGKTPIVVNITGLGTAVEKGGLTKKAIITAYKFAFRNAKTVFVQNEENRQFFVQNNIAKNKLKLLPGSGVNVSQWKPLKYPEVDECIRFLYVGRLMEDKGIAELVQATKRLKDEGETIEGDLVGFCEEDYRVELDKFNIQKYVTIHGEQMDIVPYLTKAHAVVLPSYHEGMANVLLEAAASARPVLASNISGCKETFDEGKTGIGFKCRDVDSLVTAMRKFISLPHEIKKQMGIYGREKMEKEFDRNVVVEKYINELNEL